MMVIPPYHGPMCDNTYKLLVAVDIPLHNVLVVDNCHIPLVLYLFQNLLLLALHHYSPLYLLSVHYNEAPDYIVWYCTKVVMCCIVVARYYMVVVQYYTDVAQCCMGLQLD
jgi:hypothetical protein